MEQSLLTGTSATIAIVTGFSSGSLIASFQLGGFSSLAEKDAQINNLLTNPSSVFSRSNGFTFPPPDSVRMSQGDIVGEAGGGGGGGGGIDIVAVVPAVIAGALFLAVACYGVYYLFIKRKMEERKRRKENEKEEHVAVKEMKEVGPGASSRTPSRFHSRHPSNAQSLKDAGAGAGAHRRGSSFGGNGLLASRPLSGHHSRARSSGGGLLNGSSNTPDDGSTSPLRPRRSSQEALLEEKRRRLSHKRAKSIGPKVNRRSKSRGDSLGLLPEELAGLAARAAIDGRQGKEGHVKEERSPATTEPAAVAASLRAAGRGAEKKKEIMGHRLKVYVHWGWCFISCNHNRHHQR